MKTLIAVVIVGFLVVAGMIWYTSTAPQRSRDDHEATMCALRGGDYIYQGRWVCQDPDF